MCRTKLKHVTARHTKNKGTRYYFRRRNCPIIRLTGEPSSKEFLAQYKILLDASSEGLRWSKAKKKNIESLMKRLVVDPRPTEKFIAVTNLYKSVRGRSRSQHNEKCGISKEWILEKISQQNDRCAISNIPFSYEKLIDTKDKRNPCAPSVDRIDNMKGYSKRNCRIVLLAVNVGMNLWGEEFYKTLCESVAKNG